MLIPEKPFDIEEVCAALRHRHENRNRYASIVVVAEGAVPAAGGDFVHAGAGELDAFGHVRLGGIGDALAKEIEQRTGYESRTVVLGHVQRGGTPTAFDRVLSTRFGIAAIDAVHDGAFGQMVALRAGEIVRVPLGGGDRRAEARVATTSTTSPRSSSARNDPMSARAVRHQRQGRRSSPAAAGASA